MPDAKTAQTLAVNVIEDVMMGVQVLPAECREFARVDVSVGIRTELVGLAPRPTRHWKHAPYAEPKDRPAQFGRAWKKPDPGSIAAMQAAGFDLQASGIDLDATASDPAAIWLASPALVAVGDLASLSHGA